MIPFVPYTFRTAGIVDVENGINGNLRQFQDDIQRANDRRYTYCAVPINIDNVVDTDTTEQRTFTVPNPTGSFQGEVVGVELSIYATSGVTWTAALSDGTRTASLAVATAGATTEALNATPSAFQLQFSAVLSASAGSTIARGTLTVYLRFDRQIQNASSRLDYTPTLYQAATSTAGSNLDTELTTMQAAVTRTATTNVFDIRCEVFVLRKSASAITWRVPNGAGRTALDASCFLVANIGESVTFAATSGSLIVNGAGTGAIATGNFTQSNGTDAPTTSGSDTIVTLTPAGGTVEQAILFLFWR